MGRLANCVVRFCNSHFGHFFYLHREHLYCSVYCGMGRFWQTVLGVLQQSFGAFFFVATVFWTLGIRIERFAFVLGVFNTHSEQIFQWWLIIYLGRCFFCIYCGTVE
jgi:hypothetical protein